MFIQCFEINLICISVIIFYFIFNDISYLLIMFYLIYRYKLAQIMLSDFHVNFMFKKITKKSCGGKYDYFN